MPTSWFGSRKQNKRDFVSGHKEPCNVCGVQRLEAEACLAKVGELARRRRGRPTNHPEQSMQVS